MNALPEVVYREHVVPRVLGPSAELILDALPALERGARVVEANVGLGILTRLLHEQVREARGAIWAFDPIPSHVGALLGLESVKAAIAASPEELPLADGCADLVVVNGLNAGRKSLARSLKECARVLQSGGDLVVTLPLKGSFGEVVDLLMESLEAREEGDLCRRLVEARAEDCDVDQVKTLAERAGLEVSALGVEERALFTRGPIVQDPLFTVALPMSVVGSAPPLPWSAVDEAVMTYFRGEPFSVRLNTAILVANKV